MKDCSILWTVEQSSIFFAVWYISVPVLRWDVGLLGLLKYLVQNKSISIYWDTKCTEHIHGYHF